MIVGLVAHLTPNEPRKQHALDAMARRDDLELGELQSHRVPVVIDSPRTSVEDSTAWIQALSGVIHIDVVYVHFDEGGPEEHGAAESGISTVPTISSTPDGAEVRNV